MATIVRGYIPADQFALREALAAMPEVEFEIEQIADSGETILPLLWVHGANDEMVQRVLGDDPSVENLVLLTELEDARLYRMDWIERVQLVLQMITQSRATIIDAYGAGDGWYLRVLFPTRSEFSRTMDFCDEHNLTFEIRTIHEMEGGPAGRFGLTQLQYEALTSAVEHGYYEIPRESKLAELAEELDISHQALSERLRRGTKALIEDALLIGARSEEEEEDAAV